MWIPIGALTDRLKLIKIIMFVTICIFQLTFTIKTSGKKVILISVKRTSMPLKDVIELQQKPLKEHWQLVM